MQIDITKPVPSLIVSEVKNNPGVISRQMAKILGVPPQDASDLLSAMHRDGHLFRVPEANANFRFRYFISEDVAKATLEAEAKAKEMEAAERKADALEREAKKRTREMLDGLVLYAMDPTRRPALVERGLPVERYHAAIVSVFEQYIPNIRQIHERMQSEKQEVTSHA